MTSNLGSHLIRENFDKITDANREQIIEKTQNEVFELLKQTIRPEFLNRIDELIMFTPLSEEEIRQVVVLQIDGVAKMLLHNGISLEVTDKAIGFIAKEGYDPQFGARPVKRVIQRLLLNELSKKIISGEISTASKVRVDEADNKLVFDNK